MNPKATTLTPQASPLFIKTYDLLKWLIPLTLKFPRQHRFVMAAALQQSAQAVQLHLLQAQRAAHPLGRLLHADVALAQLRLQIRLCHDWQLITPGQFEHAARLADEIGRLLGAWIKTCRAQQDPRA